MKKLSANQIRKIWLDFFASKGHMIEPGASLVPHNDPTLLWINSGVAALKKYFDGSEIPASKRIVNVQKSLRTNDIDHVGMTARHHTFFEMLGNFSIGDYFRKEAIEWAFELLTSPKWFGFDLSNLYFTVHPNDKESKQLWLDLGISEQHIIALEGNYWEIGEGPCGPNTEIFYDRGFKYDPKNLGIRLLQEDIENDRYIEIWNIVFSQFNAKAGLKREDYPELPQKNIDTGAGLERIACVFQQVETNFETDLFQPIIQHCAQLATLPYGPETKMAYHVIADHIRTCTFALADGAMFSNEGRGYVLRRILRRAARFGKKIGIQQPFLHHLSATVVHIMQMDYPYLSNHLSHIQKIVKTEEEKFLKTLTYGEELLLQYLDKKPAIVAKDVAFKLYDTFGFPLELTREIASERHIQVDETGFLEEMEEQRQRARNARDVGGSMKRQSADLLAFDTPSIFTYQPQPITATIIGLFKNGEAVSTLSGKGEVILNQTNFYAESGGQVADTGYLINEHGQSIIVHNVNKAPNRQHLHFVDTGDYVLHLDEVVELHIDLQKRMRIMRHHSSAHLLQKALIQVVGSHIHQAGSYVDDQKVRFDFTHFEKVNAQQLEEVERKVNEWIDAGLPCKIQLMELDEAKKLGAIALFDEKYDDQVRVVQFGDVSIELCGGCHVDNTSDIGVFAIEFEESISSGVRRIQASVGLSGYHFFKSKEAILRDVSQQLNALSIYEANDRLQAQIQLISDQKLLIEQLKIETAKAYTQQILQSARTNYSYPVMIQSVHNLDKDVILKVVDGIKSSLKTYFIYIINVSDDKLNLLAAASQDLVTKGLNCGKLIKETSLLAKGGGGGRPDMAQAGGKDVSKIDEILLYVNNYLLGFKGD